MAVLRQTSYSTLVYQGFKADQALRSRARRPPDFAPSSEAPGGYVGQAVLETTERILWLVG